MVAKWLLPLVMTATLVLAGCTEPSRDLGSEAADREEYAQEHDRHDPVARLTGPETVAPGALVWFSAEGSHDPDFIGAKRERDEAREAGGVHYQDDASSVSFSWYADLTTGSSSLGPGIREYRWSIDGGPTLVAPELTERYGTEDGPVRIPVGFTEPGRHTIRLQIVDWSGATDTIVAPFEVAEGGAGTSGDLAGFAVTEEGWTYTRTVDVGGEEYGQCPLGHDSYDSVDDHVRIPWDVLFFAESLLVDATWDRPAAPGPADALASPVHTTDLDMTLGHCAQDSVFERFKAEQDPMDDGWEGGTVSLVAFSQQLEKTGHKTEFLAEWDHDLYTSDDGAFRGGTATTATVAYTFVPADDTSGGGY